MNKLFDFRKDKEFLYDQLEFLLKILYPITIIGLVLAVLLALSSLILSPFFALAPVTYILTIVNVIIAILFLLLFLKWISVTRPRIAARRKVTYQVPFLALVGCGFSIVTSILQLFSGAGNLFELLITLAFSYLYFMTFRAAYLIKKG